MAGLAGVVRSRQKVWINEAVLKQTNLILPLVLLRRRLRVG